MVRRSPSPLGTCEEGREGLSCFTGMRRRPGNVPPRDSSILVLQWCSLQTWDCGCVYKTWLSEEPGSGGFHLCHILQKAKVIYGQETQKGGFEEEWRDVGGTQEPPPGDGNIWIFVVIWIVGLVTTPSGKAQLRFLNFMVCTFNLKRNLEQLMS